MWWALLALGIIYLALRFPEFRRLLLILGGIVVIGFAILSVVAILQSRQREQERERQEKVSRIQREQQDRISRTLIRPTEITLDDLRLGLDNGGQGFSITGRVKNNSVQHTLTYVRLKATIQDSLLSGKCETVGEDSVEIVMRVPAGQVRDFRESRYLGLSTIRLRGRLAWYYSVVEIKGE
jgi:hypothetical protein